jgi:hypothetical protein
MPCVFTHSLKNVEVVDLVMGAVFFFTWASRHLLWRFELNCAGLLAALRFVHMHARQMFACSVLTLTLVLRKDSYK